jgi:hypothetical protein
MSGIAQQLGRVEDRHLTLAAAQVRLHEAERQRLKAVEETIGTSLSVFEAINDAALAAQALPTEQRDPAAEQIIAHYRRWFDCSQRELQFLLSLEAAGHAVAGADEFKHALAEARLFGYESDRLIRTVRALDEGHGLRFEEAMGELRRRHSPGSLE